MAALYVFSLAVLGIVCQSATQQNYPTQKDCIESLPPFITYAAQLDIRTWYALEASQRASSRHIGWHFTGTQDDACLIKNSCLRLDVTSSPLVWTESSCNKVRLRFEYGAVPEGYNITFYGQDGTVIRSSISRTVLFRENSHSLLYYCYDDGSRDFLVWSSKRSMSPLESKVINEKLDEHGWSRMERVRPFIDENCPVDA